MYSKTEFFNIHFLLMTLFTIIYNLPDLLKKITSIDINFDSKFLSNNFLFISYILRDLLFVKHIIQVRGN